MKQTTQENSQTLEWLYENKYYDEKDNKKWSDHKGTCKAVHQFKNMMGVVQYHNEP
jgi:predicted nucleotidyltransferase